MLTIRAKTLGMLGIQCRYGGREGMRLDARGPPSEKETPPSLFRRCASLPRGDVRTPHRRRPKRESLVPPATSPGLSGRVGWYPFCGRVLWQRREGTGVGGVASRQPAMRAPIRTASASARSSSVVTTHPDHEPVTPSREAAMMRKRRAADSVVNVMVNMWG